MATTAPAPAPGENSNDGFGAGFGDALQDGLSKLVEVIGDHAPSKGKTPAAVEDKTMKYVAIGLLAGAAGLLLWKRFRK